MDVELAVDVVEESFGSIISVYIIINTIFRELQKC